MILNNYDAYCFHVVTIVVYPQENICMECVQIFKTKILDAFICVHLFAECSNNWKTIKRKLLQKYVNKCAYPNICVNIYKDCYNIINYDKIRKGIRKYYIYIYFSKNEINYVPSPMTISI